MRQKKLTETLELEYSIQEPSDSPYRTLAKPLKMELAEKELEIIVKKTINADFTDLVPRLELGYEEMLWPNRGRMSRLYIRQQAGFPNDSIKLTNHFVAILDLNAPTLVRNLFETFFSQKISFLVSGPYYGDIDELKKDLIIIQTIHDKYLLSQQNNLKNALKSYQVGMSAAVLAGLSTYYLTESLVYTLIGAGLGSSLLFLKRFFEIPTNIIKDANELSFNSKHYLIGKEAVDKITSEDSRRRDIFL